MSEPLQRLRAHYRIRAGAADIEAIAQAVALEQSVEVPLDVVRDAWVRDNIVGRVESITPAGEHYEVCVALAAETTGLDAAQMMNMLFGNSSMHDRVELAGVDFPPEFIQSFGGPRFGSEGIRQLLGADAGTDGAGRRPLTCAALKPQGLPIAELARICLIFARNGIDVIKDDHGLADQQYSPFAERVRACQRAVEQARRETGRRVLYAPSLVGSPSVLMKQARLLREDGVGAALIAPALVGLPVFQELVAEHLQVPVLAHPSYVGASRIAPAFLLGRLFRLFGADAVIYPHYMGRFAWSEKLCADIARESLSPWPGVRAAIPVPAGGMTVERVPELVRFYGSDVMLLIGGSLLRADDGRDGLAARTREFVASARAASAPVSTL
jgi:ribulose-bisphosphate carboxylase large chain